jgi:hypothetical protein
MITLYHKNHLGLWVFELLDEDGHRLAVAEEPGYYTKKQMLSAIEAAKALLKGEQA